MRLIDIIPLTRIPHALPQVLSYFHGAKILPAGALVQIPLGRRQEEGVVIGTRDLASHKMEIKSADFELRNISKVISLEPVLTTQQLELALFLGQYYFCSPGIFAKMGLPKPANSKQLTINNKKNPPTKNHKLKTKNSTLIIVPTIACAHSYDAPRSPDTILWHSELTRKQKNETWQKVKLGQARTIIGTRSAVFLPFNNLREIIVADAASPNHKSWDMFPHYDSRVAAQKLAEIFGAKLTLKTPPLAIGHSPLAIIDMRQELKNGNFSIFSIPLYDAVKNALAAKKQAILFINRRGAANFILCRDCGYIAKCKNCAAPLAYHLINNKPSLLCHHCGAKDTPPGRCPKCHSLKIKTVGSGSQKVETETHNFFPDAKIARLDSDNAPKPKDQQKTITDFIEGKTDILIATPMILSWLAELAAAEPAVVGILSADTLLHIPDFRSGERTWQTITNLQQLLYCHPERSERSRGVRQRAETRATDSLDSPPRHCGAQNDKTFFIQTYNPDNSLMKYVATNDAAGFAKEDLETRQALNYPPFSQIVKLTFRHRDAKRAGQEAKILTAKLRQANKNDRIDVSDALPAFLPRERGQYIWNIILKFTTGDRQSAISAEFIQRRNHLLQYVPQNWEIDVDPENLL